MKVHRLEGGVTGELFGHPEDEVETRFVGAGRFSVTKLTILLSYAMACFWFGLTIWQFSLREMAGLAGDSNYGCRCRRPKRSHPVDNVCLYALRVGALLRP